MVICHFLKVSNKHHFHSHCIGQNKSYVQKQSRSFLLVLIDFLQVWINLFLKRRKMDSAVWRAGKKRNIKEQHQWLPHACWGTLSECGGKRQSNIVTRYSKIYIVIFFKNRGLILYLLVRFYTWASSQVFLYTEINWAKVESSGDSPSYWLVRLLESHRVDVRLELQQESSCFQGSSLIVSVVMVTAASRNMRRSQ